MRKKYLHLEDGTTLEGEELGFDGETNGEVVFSTGMTGYPQSLTDPSFAGQILVFTYPIMGNFGVPKPQIFKKHLMQNLESEKIWVQGVVVARENKPSHHESVSSLGDWLKKEKIVGITGVDTRCLTLKLREKGVMKGIISPTKQAPDWKKITIRTSFKEVSLTDIEIYEPAKRVEKTIALIDCGVKHGIIRVLLKCQYKVIRVPFDYCPVDLPQKIDGVVCSNGPGDPKDWTESVESIRKVLQKRLPFLGICLGHQLLSLAIGADTYKLSYGHRGLNQPCLNLKTNQAFVTSQNHGYAVDPQKVPHGFEEWFMNLNDKTNEGIRHTSRPIMSTQFHPEGCPGPFDTDWVFEMFREL